MTYHSLCGCLNKFISYDLPDSLRIKILELFGDKVGRHYKKHKKCFDKAGRDIMWISREPLPIEVEDD